MRRRGVPVKLPNYELDQIRQALREAVKRSGSTGLEPAIRALAEQHGMPPRRVRRVALGDVLMRPLIEIMDRKASMRTVKAICLQCGQEYLRGRYAARQKCCSPSCSGKWSAAQVRLAKEQRHG